MHKYNRWIIFVVTTVLFSWAMLALLAIYQFSTPVFFSGTYDDGEGKTSFNMPLNTFDTADTADLVYVELDMYLSSLYPRSYKFLPDDCLEDMWINGVHVQEEEAFFCSLKGRNIYLWDYLEKGVNHLKITLRDFGGLVSLRINVANNDPLFIFIRIMLLLLPTIYGLFLLKFLGARRNIFVLFGIIVFVSIFTKYYDSNVPYYEYSYDADGHIEYAKYMENNWSIPPAQGNDARGWEFYQPPMYYVILAGWIKTGTWLNRSFPLLLNDMETISWLFMTISLAITAWLSTLLFTKKNEWKYQYIFVAFVGLMPINIFQSSRITNDVLFYLITLLTLVFLLRWWKKSKWRDWYITIFIIAIGLLVKSNAIPLVAAALFCLALKPKVRLFQKVRVGLLSIIIITMIVGWYEYQRFVVEGEKGLVGNLGGLSSAMMVPNSLENYVTFNPSKVLDIPFNNVWSDEHRRQYFWEYFYRSMYFGEFDFGHRLRSLATVLLMVTLPLVVVSIIGIAMDMSKFRRGNLPVWMVGGGLMSAALGYRLTASYSCNQDFRFIAPIIVIFAFYIISGSRHLPKGVENAVLQIAGACIFISAIFILLLI